MIELKNISKSYHRPGEQPLQVLDSVSLTIQTGEYVAIIGPSGSGKSTLMNLLGLLDRPNQGEYHLGGIHVAQMDNASLANVRNAKIGFIFQQFHLLPRTTAVENVALPLLYGTESYDREKAVKALCQVGLEDRLSHIPSQLSGGQQQRVAIARALVTNPDLILADEPTGNLDATSSAAIMDIFEQLHRSGRTIVVITHDPQVAKRASRVLSMEHGQLLERESRVLGGVA